LLIALPTLPSRERKVVDSLTHSPLKGEEIIRYAQNDREYLSYKQALRGDFKGVKFLLPHNTSHNPAK